MEHRYSMHPTSASYNLPLQPQRTVRRQLFLPLDDNYFSLSTTITLSPVGGAEGRPGRKAKPARFCFYKWSFPCCRRLVGAVEKWESWFWISTFPPPTLPILFLRAVLPEIGRGRRSCGNVGILPARGEIPKGLVERVGSLLLAFHAFHSPAFPQLSVLPVFGFGAARHLIRHRPDFPPVDSSWRALPGNSGCSAR